MPVYTFETIGSAQALAFNPRLDQLIFSTPGASASNIRVGVDRNTGNISITSELTGRSVVVGGLYGYSGPIVTFDDGTRLVLGSSSGRASADLLVSGHFGGSGISAGAGNDTLMGGSQTDLLTGGEGRDLFIIRPPRPGSELVRPDAAFHPSTAPMDQILDWSAGDSLSFGPVAGNTGNFTFLSATTIMTSAVTQAVDALIARGVIDFVAVPVGSDLYVFADSKQDNGAADSCVILKGYNVGGVLTLPTITASQIVATPSSVFVPDTQLQAPTAPAPPSGLRDSTISGNMDTVQLSSLLGADIIRNDSTGLLLTGSAYAYLSGTGFTYDNNAQLTGGTLTVLNYSRQPSASSDYFQAIINVTGVSVASFGNWVATNASETALRTLFAGNNLINGVGGTDLLRGYGGDDVIHGNSTIANSPTFDSLFGGDGDDRIFAGTVMRGSQTFMRGEAGNDYMVGSGGFDDMHGNQGQDTVIGGAGDDWVVGGQDNDRLYGQESDDIVYGNMGDDICVGGDGADIVRGGQNDDMVYGDAGNDWLSGDRGNDTLTGGAGADIFYAMRETGVDRVLDFKVREGDRVMLDVGTLFTVYQAGADTVIDLTGGHQMVLVGVNMADLSAGWIFFG